MKPFPVSRTVLLFVLMLLVVGVGVFVWQQSRNPERPPIVPESTAFFRDAAAESGITFRMNFLPGEQGEKFKINLYDHGSGVAVGDYDGDGYDDVYFVNQLGPNALYRNKGDGTFEDRTKQAGVALGDRICVAATFADYDNDGHQDLFVTSTRGGNVLFRNLGNGQFRDVTKQAGLQLIGHCQSAHFFDYDRDGHLDLLVTRTAKWTEAALEPRLRYYLGKSTYFETAGSEKEYNVLYRNNGNGTFTDVSEAMGLKGLGWGADAAVFDYDGDGYLDVAITSMFGRAQLYRNKKGSGFEEVTKEVLGKTSWGGMGVYPFDFNNDGKLDLYVVDMHSDMYLPFDANLKSLVNEKKKNRYVAGAFDDDHPRFAELMKDEKVFADIVQLKYDEVLFGNTFFKNQSNGKFVELSDKANLETFWPWGIACGDYDNDGYEDVFIPAGMGYPFEHWPNSLMMNDGKESFINRVQEYGIEPPKNGLFLPEKIGGKQAPRSSRAAAVADFDRDGRLDIMVNNFNDHPYYLRNAGARGNYLALRLTGTKSNRDALGAVVRLHVGNEVMTRQVHSACGYLAQSSKVLHFGLGGRDKIDRIEVTWPSGQTQSLPPPALNKLHAATEPK